MMKRQVISRVQRCALLLVICGISYQQLQALALGGKPVEAKAPEGKAEKGKDVGKETAAKKAQEPGRIAKMRAEAARVKAAEVGGKSAPESAGAKAPEVSPAQRNLANRSADQISSGVVDAAKGANKSTPNKFRQTVTRLITEPMMKTWLQMRKLEVKKQGEKENGIDLNNSQEIKSTATSEEVGLMNKRIDNIVDSVVEMYNKGLSGQEVGKFVKNSVQLALITPVVGVGAAVGAGVGVGVGAAAGFAIGIPLGDFILSPVLAGRLGGELGSAGARGTSQFLQSTGRAVNRRVQNMWNGKNTNKQTATSEPQATQSQATASQTEAHSTTSVEPIGLHAHGENTSMSGTQVSSTPPAKLTPPVKPVKLRQNQTSAGSANASGTQAPSGQPVAPVVQGAS